MKKVKFDNGDFIYTDNVPAPLPDKKKKRKGIGITTLSILCVFFSPTLALALIRTYKKCN